MPQLNILTFLPQVFWLVVLFSILYIFMHYLFLPSVTNNIALRNKKLEKEILATQELLKECNDMRTSIDILLQKTKAEANIISTTAEHKASLFLNSKIAEANLQVEAYMDAQKSQINILQAKLTSEMPQIVDDVKNSILDLIFLNTNNQSK